MVFHPQSDKKRRVGREALKEISRKLDRLTAEDFGVPQSKGMAEDIIEYTDVFATRNMIICIFKLPAGFQLPMHDHPHMTVFSKVLWGQMEVEAYDRVEGEPKAFGLGERLQQIAGKVSQDPFTVTPKRVKEVWTSSEGVQVTLPNDGNIHQFKAISACCVVDVLAPPYDFKRGRKCTYYDLIESGGTLKAKPVRCPEYYVTRSVPYSGLEPDPTAIQGDDEGV